MTNYSIGDFLIRLKNASLANKHEVEVRKTKLIESVAKTLKKAGYLADYKVEGEMITLTLAIKSKKPVLMNVKLVSKQGLRIYQNVDQIAAHRGASILIISTPKGILTSRDAIKENCGGEVIAEIW